MAWLRCGLLHSALERRFPCVAPSPRQVAQLKCSPSTPPLPTSHHTTSALAVWDIGEPVGVCRNGSSPGVFERDWTYGTARVDCNAYTGEVPCNPADKACGQPPGPPPPPPAPPGNFSVHNCTSCQGAGGVQLGDEHTNLSLNDCLGLCVADPQCRYVNWVEPAKDGECTLWSSCGELCLTDHCWQWWTTWENRNRPDPVVWNATVCDSLPEQPSLI